MKSYIECKVGIKGMFIKNSQILMLLEDGKGVTWWCWKGGEGGGEGVILRVMFTYIIDGQIII